MATLIKNQIQQPQTVTAQPAAQQQTAQANANTVATNLSKAPSSNIASTAATTANKPVAWAQSPAQANGNAYMSGYQSNYADQLNDLYNQILDRGNFKYDMNADMLYQQYKDQYVENGKQASLDAQGQSAALTGGYGNSYGAMAGSQAYQQYLKDLNGALPELYGKSEATWNRGTDDLRDKYGTAFAADASDYERYTADRNQAYNIALQLMQTGVMPSTDMLAVAGISEEDAKAYVKKYLADQAYERMIKEFQIGYGQPVATGGGGGGSRKTSNNTNATADQVKAMASALFNTASKVTNRAADAGLDAVTGADPSTSKAMLDALKNKK